jgi:ribosomal protein L20A (L18A)
VFKDYGVWRRSHSESKWSRTSHNVKARTEKEAQAKVARKFSGYGFSSMSLVAVEQGLTPNV